MRQTAIALCTLSTLILFNGCATQPSIKYVNIPQKCSVPNITPPRIDNTPCGDDYKCIVVKAINNYTNQKEYSEELNAAIDACR